MCYQQPPFVVVGIHADNGSEYVNHAAATLLDEPHVREPFERSVPRRSARLEEPP